MKVRLIKLNELEDARHPHNIPEGYFREGEALAEPRVGEGFYVGCRWSTSSVKEIVDEHTFKTCNSVYRWEEIKD